MNSKDSFCPIPWNHVSTHPNGNARICCDMNQRAKPTLCHEDGRPLNLQIDSVKSLRNHPRLKKMRTEMLGGIRPEACASCWKKEDLKLRSRRQSLNEQFLDVRQNAVQKTKDDGSILEQDFPVTYFDLRLGNKCNLMCKTCGPEDSSLWMNHLKMGLKSDWDENSKLLQDFKSGKFKKTKVLYFTGGEPLINRHHWSVLEFLIDQRQSYEVELQYNSNVTVIPPESEKIWSRFKRVHVTCSVDGIGKTFEEIRPPGRWSVVEKNLKILDEMNIPLTLEISPTISALNVAHIPEMILWVYRQSFRKISPLIGSHLLFYPQNLSVQTLPESVKCEVAESFEGAWVELASIGADEALVRTLRARFSAVINHMMAHRLLNA